MKNKYAINIDKAEFCYTAPSDKVEELKNTQYHERDGFRILGMDADSKTETFLQVEVLFDKDNDTQPEWMKFATLKIGSTFEDADSPTKFVWMRICNEALYTKIYPDKSILPFAYFIADELGLTFNNITKMDIALDVSYNSFDRIKKAIRNLDYTPIILGKSHTNPKEIIDRVLYIHTADRIRYRTQSLVISTKEKDLSLCVYNKGEEIRQNGKSYISEWDGIGSNIYRNEVRLKRASIADYLHHKGMKFEGLYLMLTEKETLFDMFLYFSNKVIRFRHGRKSLSLLEL